MAKDLNGVQKVIGSASFRTQLICLSFTCDELNSPSFCFMINLKVYILLSCFTHILLVNQFLLIHIKFQALLEIWFSSTYIKHSLDVLVIRSISPLKCLCWLPIWLFRSGMLKKVQIWSWWNLGWHILTSWGRRKIRYHEALILLIVKENCFLQRSQGFW